MAFYSREQQLIDVLLQLTSTEIDVCLPSAAALTQLSLRE